MIDVIHGGNRLGEGEIVRVEVHHPPERIAGSAERDATFVRLVRTHEHPETIYLTLFAESDPPETARLHMVLWPDVTDELIGALTEMRSE